MRDRFPLVVIGGLLLFGFVGNFVLKAARRASFADLYSTYRSEPDGARALFLLAQESGLNVTREQRDFEQLEPNGALVLLGVEFQEHSEVKQVGPLFFAPDGGVAEDEIDEEESARRGANAYYAPDVSVDEREKLFDHLRKGGTLVYAPWRAQESPFLKELGVSLVAAEKKLGIRTLAPAVPSPWTFGAERAEARVAVFLDLPSKATPLLVDPLLGETVAALIPYGQGRIVLLGAPELATNAALARADNAQLWLSLLREAQGTGGFVAFDEFHHGFTNDRSIAEFARRYGLQFAFAQLLLGALLWAAALRRFGRPRAPEEEQRVGSTDALFAQSRLYREGGHRQFAASQIVRGVVAELAHLAACPSRAGGPEVAQALRERGRGELATALTELLGQQGAVSTDADFQKLARTAAGLRARIRVRRAAPALKSASPSNSTENPR